MNEDISYRILNEIIFGEKVCFVTDTSAVDHKLSLVRRVITDIQFSFIENEFS